MAAKAYAKKDFSGTISNYEKVLGVDPKNDDAYYYIAMAKWNGGDQAGAIPYFARASVLNKKRAMKAREYLEQLYKAENSDSLDGLEDLLAKAKADLGVS
jgi:tetratricopeptide (TPR) repeat protein